MQNVLSTGDVTGCSQPPDIGQEVRGAIRQVIFIGILVSFFDARVSPECGYDVGQLGSHFDVLDQRMRIGCLLFQKLEKQELNRNEKYFPNNQDSGLKL